MPHLGQDILNVIGQSVHLSGCKRLAVVGRQNFNQSALIDPDQFAIHIDHRATGKPIDKTTLINEALGNWTDPLIHLGEHHANEYLHDKT